MSFILRYGNDDLLSPSGSHHGQAVINTEPAPKIILQNRLTRARAKLTEAKAALQAQGTPRVLIPDDNISLVLEQDANSVGIRLPTESAEEKADVRFGRDATLDANTGKKYLEAKHQVAFYATSVALLQKEIEVVNSALGG